MCDQNTAHSEQWLCYDESHRQYTAMHGANLNTLFIFSDDPNAYGYDWIIDCETHENEASGSLLLIDPNGQVLCWERMKKIRGRGNGTWHVRHSKAPFQINLQRKVNLLNPSDPSQRAKKWILLAEQMDPQLLHNRIAYDMALELGLSESSESTSVDLYYDGIYRGVYTLCEKVEIGTGRVEIRDFDKQFKHAGFDETTARQASGTNAYGRTITYFEGLPETILPRSADYLVELEGGSEAGTGTLRINSSWFMHSTGRAYALKSPEYASRDMLCCVSESLEELWSIIENAGIHPESRRTIDQILDVDAMARASLIYHYAYCPDGMAWSSFYLIYDSQNDFWRPGPVWDFDLSMRFHPGGDNEGGFGLSNTYEHQWLSAVLKVPQIQDAMQRIWENEMKPMIHDILLGSGKGRYLQSFDAYTAQIAPSRKMNEVLHPIPPTTQRFEIGDTMEKDTAMKVGLQRDFVLLKKTTWSVEIELHPIC